MTENYEDIMEQSWDDIPTDKLIPIGSYRLKGTNMAFVKAKSADANDAFLFVYSVMEAEADVDPDELALLGDYDLSAKKVFFRAWLESAADYDNVRKHLKKHGIDPGGRTVKESAEAFKGTEVIAYLEHRTFENNIGETVQENSPKQFAPTED